MRIHYSIDDKKASDKKLTFEQANYFREPLFNQTAHRYLHSLFGNLVRQFTLTTAKGGAGWKFLDKPSLVKEMERLPDMPYHMHILNGLFPAMKLLEKFAQENGWLKDERFPCFLQAFITGFTFHDTNKLVGKELREAVREDLPKLCAQLHTEQFFPEWQDWLPEIQFLALRTEYGDTSFAYKDYGNRVREFDLMNKSLSEFCHLADHFASLEFQQAADDPENEHRTLQNASDLFQDVSNYSFGGKKLKDLWNLSWVGVGETICTLLAQKLLNEAQQFVQTVRVEDILLHTRNGFVFLGEPLTNVERETIAQRFTEGDDDPVKQTLITFQQASFGFTKSRALEEDDLKKIVEAGIVGYPRIQLFTVSDVLVTPGEKPQAMLEAFLATQRLPFKFLPKSKTNPKSRFVPDNLDDWMTDPEKRAKWELFALQKIKFLKRTASKEVKPWADEYQKVVESFNTFFGDQANLLPTDYSEMTLAALVSIASEKVSLEEKVKTVRGDLLKLFPKEPASGGNATVLKEFAQTYLTGNFEPDWERLLEQPIEVPEKAGMCLFSGANANVEYDNSIAHGVGAVKFSNRTVNTLKSKSHHISPIFLEEIALRNGLTGNKGSNSSACIYFDFGELLVHIDSRELFELFATVKEFDYDRDWRITIDQQNIDLNFFGLRFADIDYSIKGNFYYIINSLKLIERTAFRIYTAGVISPYRIHREIFVFENCMPFVKLLGWDRVRIDEIEGRLFELNLIKRIAGKRFNSVVLEFAEDARAVFSAYRALDDEALRKDPNLKKDFFDYCLSILPNYHQHRYDMSPMKQLAELAIQMAKPQSDSSSQETKLIRSALDVLKRCHKEKQCRETTVGQITGELRQLAKSYPYFEELLAMPFAESLYDNIYRKAWQGIFPPPSRLRHWVNEFAAWYSREADIYWKKNAVKDAREALEAAAKPSDEDSVIAWLKTSKKNEKGAVEKYESLYRLAFQKFQTFDNQ